ncbi:hypothetical protein ABZ904_28785 [Streptomyces sp. NPDC046900]|uniref:hypothetical protein n=1 Tax=Streptomyces sp. NPDC046900 TaxID=3155473 RepID=UPI0033EF01C2
MLDDTRLGHRSLLRRMAADQGTDAASMIRRHSADAVRRAMNSGSWAALIRDVVQDWWPEQAPRTTVTVGDDMRQEDFLPLPLHLGALHETLRWCGEAAEAADARIAVELTVQNDTLHVWLGLDRVHVRSACEDFARLLSHTLPYTDCLVADDHVLLRLHGRPDTEVLSPSAAAGLDAYLSSADVERRQYLEGAAEEPMGEKQQVS